MGGRPVVRVMPDYDCWPLWLPRDPTNCDPHSLVSAPLARRLVAWSDAFDATLDRQVPQDSGFPDADAERRFVAEGRELAALVADELRGGYDVAYVDIATGRLEPVAPPG